MYELFTQISIFSVLTKVFSKGWVLTWVLVLNLVRCVAEIHGYVLGNIDEVYDLNLSLWCGGGFLYVALGIVMADINVSHVGSCSKLGVPIGFVAMWYIWQIE